VIWGTKRQFIVCLVVTVILALIVQVPWAISVGIHSKKIETDRESVLERIDQFEKNTTDMLSKLQSTLMDTVEKSTELEKRLNDTQLELGTKGEELESSLEMIAELQRELHSTKAETSTLEASHEQLSTDLRHTADELNTTKARVNDLEGMLETTVARVVTLEVELNSIYKECRCLAKCHKS
jgi:chromosome segregation ATPase